jgi:hypothetical protein
MLAAGMPCDVRGDLNEDDGVEGDNDDSLQYSCWIDEEASGAV